MMNSQEFVGADPMRIYYPLYPNYQPYTPIPWQPQPYYPIPMWPYYQPPPYVPPILPAANFPSFTILPTVTGWVGQSMITGVCAADIDLNKSWKSCLKDTILPGSGHMEATSFITNSGYL